MALSLELLAALKHAKANNRATSACERIERMERILTLLKLRAEMNLVCDDDVCKYERKLLDELGGDWVQRMIDVELNELKDDFMVLNGSEVVEEAAA